MLCVCAWEHERAVCIELAKVLKISADKFSGGSSYGSMEPHLGQLAVAGLAMVPRVPWKPRCLASTLHDCIAVVSCDSVMQAS